MKPQKLGFCITSQNLNQTLYNHLGHHDFELKMLLKWFTTQELEPQSQPLKLLAYNLRKCVKLDKRHSPEFAPGVLRYNRTRRRRKWLRAALAAGKPVKKTKRMVVGKSRSAEFSCSTSNPCDFALRNGSMKVNRCIKMVREGEVWWEAERFEKWWGRYGFVKEIREGHVWFQWNKCELL